MKHVERARANLQQLQAERKKISEMMQPKTKAKRLIGHCFRQNEIMLKKKKVNVFFSLSLSLSLSLSSILYVQQISILHTILINNYTKKRRKGQKKKFFFFIFK